MGEIVLPDGSVTLVDPWVYNWAVWIPLHRTAGYASFHTRTGGRNTCNYLHRVIKNAPPGLLVDHVNLNKLDNREANLRVCRQTDNQQNRAAFGGTSRFKGVSWTRHARLWRATINVGNHQVHLGYFKEETEAARVRDEAAKKYNGEFAFLNFPESN